MGVEAGGGDGELVVAVGALAFERAADIAAGLAPDAGHGATFGLDVGAEVEVVSVAGAGQRHLHGRADRRIFGPAANPLSGAVVERDGAVAAPRAGQRCKRAALGSRLRTD